MGSGNLVHFELILKISQAQILEFSPSLHKTIIFTYPAYADHKIKNNAPCKIVH